jgi:hypothetical protein
MAIYITSKDKILYNEFSNNMHLLKMLYKLFYMTHIYKYTMSLENYFFGPLDKKYCVLFYVFTVINLLLFLFALFMAAKGVLSKLFKSKSMMSLNDLLSIAYALLFSFVMYIQSRLLYSMCATSNLEESA